MEWSGPDIRPGLDNRHLIIQGVNFFCGHSVEGHRIEVLEGVKRS